MSYNYSQMSHSFKTTFISNILQKISSTSKDTMIEMIDNIISPDLEVSAQDLSIILEAISPLLTSTEMLLSCGGDDRLTVVDGIFINKYFSSTHARPEVIRRGSCTCSTITSEVLFLYSILIRSYCSLDRGYDIYYIVL